MNSVLLLKYNLQLSGVSVYYYAIHSFYMEIESVLFDSQDFVNQPKENVFTNNRHFYDTFLIQLLFFTRKQAKKNVLGLVTRVDMFTVTLTWGQCLRLRRLSRLFDRCPGQYGRDSWQDIVHEGAYVVRMQMEDIFFRFFRHDCCRNWTS